MLIRPLTEDDADLYQALRLRSLREHPEAFGSDYEDECAMTPETVAERLRPNPNRIMFGALVDDKLAGIVHLGRAPGRKIRHRAGLGAMYVAHEFRGQGVGRALVQEAIRYARTLPGLEELILAVTVGNDEARRLYLAAGFVPSHVEKRYIKVDNEDYDIEWMTLRLERPTMEPESSALKV
jgi:GNAT superfamily N-acetyltransferase